MKKNLFVSTLLLLSQLNLNSQEWLSVGTQWNFQSVFMGDPIPDDTYTITGTTVIEGKTCSILEKTYYSCDRRPIIEYIYKENGKLYYYDEALNEFLLLHDFSAEAGDTIKIPSYPQQFQYTNIDTFYVKIDSISVMEFNNLTLKKFHVLRGFKNSEGVVNFSSSTLSTKNIIIEDIGSLFNFFNYLDSGKCDYTFTTPLKSFFIPGNGTFDLDSLTNQREEIEVYNVNVFPNPFINHLNISNIPYQTAEILIYNHLGQLIETIEEASKVDIVNLDMSKYQIGIYYIVFRNSKNEKLKVLKTIKTE